MKKSNLVILIVAALLILVTVGVALWATLPAQETSDGLVFELSADKQSYAVKDMDNHWVRAVIVPAEYEGKPVTLIDAYAFQNCHRLEKITLPDTIEGVNMGAFKDCVRLSEIRLPDAVKTVGVQAFSGCTRLEKVTIPAGATLQIGAFEGCTNVKEVSSAADHIAAFPTTKLEKVTINGGNHIHERTFMGYASLREITIPASITSIEHLAFSGCDSLERVKIEDLAAWCNIDFAESDANPLRKAKNLYLDGALVSDLVIPEGVRVIAPRAFDGCTSITSVTLPASLVTIGDHAFRGTAISEIEIAESVEIVGKYVFYNCTALKNIYVAATALPADWDTAWCEGTNATVHFGETKPEA